MERANNRLMLLTLVVLLAATAIGARLWQLQVCLCDSYRETATQQHERRISVQATRGAIVDRNGRELAVSLETESLYAHPWKVEDPRRAAALLSPIIGVPQEQIRRRLNSKKNFVYLRRFLNAEAAAKIRELDLPTGGVHAFGLLSESRRHYPRGKLGVHVVGFANIDGEGVEGIEQQFDDQLQGDPSIYLLQRDAKNGNLRQLVGPAERQSVDVVLSLDLVLQHLVETELARAIDETEARAGSVILMEPSTGEILALANWPAADPNRYGSASDAERVNRALVHYYEPGSTFKVVPLAAALERETVRLNQRFDCEGGSLALNRRRIKDISPHGTLSLREILAESSNIGMVKIALTVEPSQMRESIAGFGFGEKTGIELPGESPGLLHGMDRWSSFTHASVAFGQEIGVTVLQMASALSVIANDGVMVPPRVAVGTRHPDGGFRRLPAPQTRRVISERTADQIRAMMESVITDGTGHRAAVRGYKLAGKSGTAQIAEAGGYSKSRYMASFGGFGPSTRPRLSGIVVLDSPRGEWIHGGQVAAPVFARIMSEALHYLRVPQNTDSWPRNADPQPGVSRPADVLRATRLSRPVVPGTVPDVRGLALRDAVAQLAIGGYGSIVNGSGTVVAQDPPAGRSLSAGRPCTLRLAEFPAEVVQ